MLGLIIDNTNDPAPLAQASKAMAQAVRECGAFRPLVLSGAGPFPEHVTHARVEKRYNLESLCASLPAARALYLSECAGTLAVPGASRLRRLYGGQCRNLELGRAGADAGASQPGLSYRLLLASDFHLELGDAVIPLSVSCTDGNLPPGAEAELLTATHVLLSGLRGPLPAMPAARYVELFKCTEVTSLSGMRGVATWRIRDCGDVREIRLDAAWGLHVEGCGSLESVGAMPRAEVVRVVGCPHLGALGDISSAQLVVLCACDALKEVGDLTGAHTIVAGGCASLAGVGDMSRAQRVMFDSCPRLPGSLGPFTAAKSLRVSDCEDITSISGMVAPKDVVVMGCGALLELHGLGMAHSVTVTGCGRLRELGSLSAAKEVTLTECGVTAIGSLTSARRVELDSLNDLRQLGELSAARVVFISSCGMRELSDLPEAVNVDLWGNDNLATVGNMPHVRQLRIKLCPALHCIGSSLPEVEAATITECPSLKDVPEMPATAQVIRW